MNYVNINFFNVDMAFLLCYVEIVPSLQAHNEDTDDSWHVMFEYGMFRR